MLPFVCGVHLLGFAEGHVFAMIVIDLIAGEERRPAAVFAVIVSMTVQLVLSLLLFLPLLPQQIFQPVGFAQIGCVILVVQKTSLAGFPVAFDLS